MSTDVQDQQPTRLNGHPPRGGVPGEFVGFERPDANFVFTPNQFLDLCVPRCSRGCVRLVGYMIRHLLGWRDADGEPLYDKVEVSQRELERQARVGKTSINAALTEAEDLGFIQCVKRGRPNSRGKTAISNAWTLRWDDAPDYAETLDAFNGFYRGEGRRTTIPNQFFDRVLPYETHAVVKVVGTVLRHTVGYRNRLTGGTVSQAPLSFTKICEYACMGRTTLRRTLPLAVNANYIERVSMGRFAAASEDRIASVYAIHWSPKRNAPKMAPAKSMGPETERPENGPSPTPRFRPQERSDNGPSERPENGPTRNKEQIHPQRQQQPAAVLLEAADVDTIVRREIKQPESSPTVALLEAEGLDRKTAEYLADLRTLSEVRDQIAWLPHRRAMTNRLGLLRRAIEDGYGPPPEVANAEAARATAARKAERLAVMEHEDRRREHEDRYRHDYLAFVGKQSADMKRDHPQRYAEAAAKHDAERKSIEAGDYPPKLRATLLKVHRREETWWSALLREFRNELPDFWAWDQDHNPHRLPT
ncbi:MAG: hypothetical protein AAF916_08865 [Planctomycetota bacterium]